MADFSLKFGNVLLEEDELDSISDVDSSSNLWFPAFRTKFLEQLAAANANLENLQTSTQKLDQNTITPTLQSPSISNIQSQQNQNYQHQVLARNSTKTLKCPRCNWHYKYQETLEIHMKEKHLEQEVSCVFCVENQPHPKLARGETYSCGFKPYRCELCRYSTTTKGNLSIHMQSDKHLHALQEVPAIQSNSTMFTSSLPVISKTPSSSSLYNIDYTTVESTNLPSLPINLKLNNNKLTNYQKKNSEIVSNSKTVENNFQDSKNLDSVFQCLICLNFSTNFLEKLMKHLEIDRSQPSIGDIQAIHGTFQCNLCPYSTNLKANFQLHTRTDKHIQRIQLVNHMRERNTFASSSLSSVSASATLYRLAATKSIVHVRCHLCQEMFSCTSTLREHCETQSHFVRYVAYQQMFLNSNNKNLLFKDLNFDNKELDNNFYYEIDSLSKNILYYKCLFCAFVTNLTDSVVEHLEEHKLIDLLNVDQSDKQLQSSCTEINETTNENNHLTDLDFDNKTSSFVLKSKTSNNCNIKYTPILFWNELDNQFLAMNEAKFVCQKCENFYTDSLTELNEHNCNNSCASNFDLKHIEKPQQSDSEENYSKEITLNKVLTDIEENSTKEMLHKCALCALEINDDIRQHLIQEHKIMDLNVLHDLIESSNLNLTMKNCKTTENINSCVNDKEFTYKCNNCCLKFRSNEIFCQHKLSHCAKKVFQIAQRCPFVDLLNSSNNINYVNNCHDECEKTFFTDLHSLKEHLTVFHDGYDVELETNSKKLRFKNLNSNTNLKLIETESSNQELKEENLSLLLGESSKKQNDTNQGLKCGANFMDDFNLIANINDNIVSNNNNKEGKNSNLLQLKHDENDKLNETQKLLTQTMAHFLQPQVALSPPTGNDSIIDVLGKLAAQTSIDNNIDFFTLLNSQQFLEKSNNAAETKIDCVNTMFYDKIESATQLKNIVKNDKSEITEYLTLNIERLTEQLNKITDEKVIEILKIECPQCDDVTKQFVFDNIWHLKKHFEQEHNIFKLPNDILEDFCQKLKDALNNFSYIKLCVSAPLESTQDNINFETDSKENDIFCNNKNSLKRTRPDSTPALNSTLHNKNDFLSVSFLKDDNFLRKRKASNFFNNTNLFSKSETNDSTKFNEQLMNMMVAAASGNIPFLAAAAAAVAQANNGFNSNSIPFSTTSDAFTSACSNLSNSNSNFSADNSGFSIDFGSSPQKRARTRITDDQLKILRQYFDINNSPSEEKIKEMSIKAQLPEKVIKHWFRNTLFKERQRDKDSPYNFNVPPQMSIDLAAYEKTGEAKITSIKKETEEKEQNLFSNSVFPVFDTSATTSENKQNKENIQQRNNSFDSSSTSLAQNLKNDYLNSPESSSKASSPLATSNNLQKNVKSESFLNTDFMTNFNKAAALTAANNYAATFINQQNQISSDFATLFSKIATVAAAANSLDVSQEKTLSMLASAGISSTLPSFPSTSLISSPTLNSNYNAQNLSNLSKNDFSLSSTNSSIGVTSNLTVGSGRRANRTRFNDFQLRTLQSFFDRQAYPKDDDLEVLSKKLSLSPRVIVVWFQNARQKARKTIENQPNNSMSNVNNMENEKERFLRLSNLQCKRCSSVFERYFELIYHQQSLCYLNDADALKNDNKYIEDRLCEDEKQNLLTCNNETIASSINNTSLINDLLSAANQSNSTNFSNSERFEAQNLLKNLFAPKVNDNFNLNVNNNEEDTKKNEESTENDVNTENKNATNTSQDLFKLITSGRPSSEAMLKMFKNRERKHHFYKRCPFCGLLFYVREKLADHLSNKHAEQLISSNIDIDALPNTEDVPTFSSVTDKTSNNVDKLDNVKQEYSNVNDESPPLDLSFCGIQNENEESSFFSPTLSRSEDNNSTHDERIVDTFDSNSRGVSTSPVSLLANATAISALGNGILNNFQNDQQSPINNLLNTNAAACAAAAAAAANTSKRYRTHLTPLQVFIMKTLFNDYKTPSMNECDILGKEIGLHKRVVQVWFQNARAKERKFRGSGILSDTNAINNEETSATVSSSTNSGIQPTHCELCNVKFGSKCKTVQDHIFTIAHIERVKERGASLRGISASSSDAGLEEGNFDLATSQSISCSTNKSLKNNNFLRKQLLQGSATNLCLSQFPYNLMYNLQGEGMSMLYDPNLMGTPIPMLQIPESVMQMINADLAKGKTFSKFTQDGLHLSKLSSKISKNDFKCANCVENEVGWACPQCSNVFQQESFLRNHQKLICQGCDGVFRLIQIHYECTACTTRFGTQEEFRNHCDLSSHKAILNKLNNLIK